MFAGCAFVAAPARGGVRARKIGDPYESGHRFSRGKQKTLVAAEPDLRIGAKQCTDLSLRLDGKISVPAGKARGEEGRAVFLQVFAYVVAVTFHRAARGGV